MKLKGRKKVENKTRNPLYILYQLINNNQNQNKTRKKKNWKKDEKYIFQEIKGTPNHYIIIKCSHRLKTVVVN